MAFFMRKKKTFQFLTGRRHFTSGDARAYLFIHFIRTQRQTLHMKTVKLTRILSRKYIYYRKNDYSKVVKSISLSCVQIWKEQFRSINT